MAEQKQNFPDNTIYELDNLDVLRGMNSETVDLIATDPPFNTKRNRAGTAGFYVDNWKWGDTGKLPDQWAWNEVHPIWLEEIRDDNPALYEVIEATEHCHGKDIAAFLCFLSVRLLEMHRVLKPTGSLYLHCDHTANAYIRMALDAIFGAKNLRNEIVWHYYNKYSAGKKGFGNNFDTIMFYSKNNNPTFNPIREARPKPVRQLVRENIGGVLKNKKDEQGKVIYRVVEDKKVDAVWQIPCLQPASGERTGSPDQKPLALYERIILASSNPGDLVLDPFAGCATTIMAARNNGRRWVGIDRRPDARFHVVCRMEGIRAKDAEDIRKLPHLTDWLDARLARHEAHFRTEPPVRTDEGETAAPNLGPVFTEQRRRNLLNHQEMKNLLIQHCGLPCWGCDFIAPDDRYLELDHVIPKKDGGTNDLDNRALLCRPCNGAKRESLTLSALRRQNRRDKYLTRRDADHPINLRETLQWSRSYMMELVRGTPHQMTLE